MSAQLQYSRYCFQVQRHLYENILTDFSFFMAAIYFWNEIEAGQILQVDLKCIDCYVNVCICLLGRNGQQHLALMRSQRDTVSQ